MDNEVCVTKHQVIEEPCEGKLSSTVLESSGSREGVADFNLIMAVVRALTEKAYIPC
jgi:hypothetical protein